MNKQLVTPIRIAQVPLPAYPVLGNVRPGGVLLSGKLANEIDKYKLDTVDMPPSRFKSVRDDISRYSPIPVTRVALRYAAHSYIGIIDSNNTPVMFALNSQGILLRKAPDDEKAWQLFDEYMAAERASALTTRRAVAKQEQETLVIKAIKNPGARGGKFYFDRHGKVRYGKQPMHDHHVHITLAKKHDLDGHAAKLHRHLKKQRPATVHDLRKHTRAWIKDNFEATTKQIDDTTKQMLEFFHNEGALELHSGELQPTSVAPKDVPKFFKKRVAIARPILPKAFDAQGTKLLVNGKPVRVSSDAEQACYAFAKRFLVNDGKVKGHAEFVRGFEKSLQSMGVPKGSYDYKHFVARVAQEPEAVKTPKSKEQPTPKTHPHLFIKQDGQDVRLSDVRTPAGNFYTGKGKRGTWARALREEDITMNVSRGGAPKGWRGKTIDDPTKDYYLTWRHPDTDEIGYVYPSRAATYQKKFEEASALGGSIDRIREGVVHDIEKGSQRDRVAALCTYLIDKEHFRVGEESHAADTGTFGIGSLRVEHVKVDGKHVIFDFPGKKDEPWRRVVDFSKLPEALALVKSCIKNKHKSERVWEGKGWSVDSKDINGYLTKYTKDGTKFTAKMFRTFHANKYAKKMIDTVEKLSEFFDWDDATVKKLYRGFKVNDKAGQKLLNTKYTPYGKTVREVLGLEENHGAKGKGKATIGILPTIATRLGHTVSSCRNSYIDPVLVVPFAATYGWDERTLSEKKTRDDLPAFDKKTHKTKHQGGDVPSRMPSEPKGPVTPFVVGDAKWTKERARQNRSDAQKRRHARNKAAEIEKAVAIVKRPGKRGGHYHFNDQGKVVYDAQGSKPAPSSTRKFDSTEYQRQIDEHKFVETAHRMHMKRLKGEIAMADAEHRTAKPHRQAQLHSKMTKLKAEHDDHHEVVIAARAAHAQATKQMEEAKREHNAKLRSATGKRKEAQTMKRHREAIMGIGMHSIRDEDDVPAARDAPVGKTSEVKHYFASAEDKKEVKDEPVVEAEKPRGTTSLWRPGDENRPGTYERERAAREEQKRPKTQEEWYQQTLAENARRRKEPVRQHKPEAPKEEQKPLPQAKVHRDGLLSRIGRLFKRKDKRDKHEQIAASFVDTRNIFMMR